MKITCIPTKRLFSNPISGYQVYSCKPIGYHPNLQLNQYHNFTVSGNNLALMALDVEAHLDIELDPESKYPASYILSIYDGITFNEDKVQITKEQEISFLRTMMSAGQASSIHKSYPNFCSMVLNNEANQIDIKKIHGVGEKYFALYCKKISNNLQAIRYCPICNKWGIVDYNAIKALAKVYKTAEELDKAFDDDPYFVMMSRIEFGFKKADRLILEKKPELEASLTRCKAGCLEILKDNEQEGDTRLNANLLARFVKELMPECSPFIVEAVKDNPLIHYDLTTKDTAIEQTYQDELTIAKAIVDRVKHPVNDCMEWEKFKDVTGLKITDEQAEILRLASEESVAILTGGAGCVDADTEFFTGSGWKRIADYQNGDKVLQYNQDGSATLVEPMAYIKKPCDKLWHFETKYGVNQTVCDEHRIIYWSPKDYQRECTVHDIIAKQNGDTGKGWTGRFKTVFDYSGSGIDLTDEQIRVMCAVICDGSFTHTLSSNLCRFHIKKDRKKDRLRLLFHEANIEWREAKSAAEGYTDFYITAPLHIKEFTPDWYSCSNHQLQVICDEIIFWDGSTNVSNGGATRRTFSTNVRATADFVQFAFSACGQKTAIQTRDRTGEKYITSGKEYIRKSIEYTLTITNRTKTGICCDVRADHTLTPITQVPTTDDFKYCFTVPSHMLVLRRKDCIFITGNCGKTSSMKALVLMLEHYQKNYLLLAPTGVAARRLRESTGRKASTIHMHLASEADICRPDYVILEESSMLGVNLLAKLIASIPSYTKIIFVCDNAQLASISCGNLVQDILDSGIVKRANLTKVFRYDSSGLARIATDTRNGVNLDPNLQFDDYTFIKSGSDPVEQCLEQYAKYLSDGYSKQDIMILCPYNKSKIGSYIINERIQERFNANDFSGVEYKVGKYQTISFKIGDRVINKKNNYHMPFMDYDEYDVLVEKGEVFIANGDLGTIRDVGEEDGVKYLIVEFDCGLCKVSGHDITNLLLGYCISCHASQGSQAKAVVVVIDESHRSLLSRNILYVALSRSEERLALIADENIINDALQVQEEKSRETYLKEMLKSEN